MNDNPITATLWECQHCGEISQSLPGMLHMGCQEDGEEGAHKDADVIQKDFIVQPMEEA